MQKISYSKTHNPEFYKTLQQRVRAYFRENNKTKFANTNMKIKTVFMLVLYIFPFIAITTIADNRWVIMGLWFLMGIGMAGIGLSIMHDANHGAYSKNDRVNKYLGLLLYLLGGSDVNWRIQHNILHHTYTNVTGIDEDLNPGNILRFSPHTKWRSFHKFQVYYAWFFYGLMTFAWALIKDYRQAYRYHRMDLTKTQGITYQNLLFKIILSKILYFSIILVLPFLFSPVEWWFTLLCFFLMHFVCGIILSLIFQPAHVVPTSNYPVPENSGQIDADWAVSQLYNTSNFAPKSRFFSWYVGGLNFQIEHHLFPNICHVHYPQLSEIVKKTAQEFQLPYFSEKTFFHALRSHFQMLKQLSCKPQ
ncbi:MAG: acyl-CoA desaturase [Flavobacteriia bacterium]|nr:acyl-CoA desaturase [Flavobacteriia bacterium]